MRRILLALLLFVGAMPPATAQNTRAGLSILNNTYFTTNGAGSITGKMVNTWNAALLSSVGFLNGDNTWSGSNSFLNNLYFNGTGYVYSNGPGLPATFTSNPSPVLTTANTWSATQTMPNIWAGTTNWVTPLRAGWQWGDDTMTNPAVVCMGPSAATVCGSFYAQTLNNVATQTSRAVDASAYNNSTVNVGVDAWATYYECYQMSSTGRCHGNETEVVNTYGTITSFWNSYYNYDHFTDPQAIGGSYGCGAGITTTPTTYNCAAAIVVLPNNKMFQTGITFLSGSIAPKPSSLSSAINFPYNYTIEWWMNGTTSASIFADMYGDIDLVPSSSTSSVFIGSGSSLSLSDNAKVMWGTSNQSYISGYSSTLTQQNIIFGVNNIEVARFVPGYFKLSATASWAPPSSCGSLSGSTKCIAIVTPNGNVMYVPAYGTY